jgi:AcrB/AcrD/AcrF family/Outer membrane efflux protein
MKFHLRTVLVLTLATCIAHAAETATSSDVVDGSLLTLDAAVEQALAKAPALRARQAGLEAAQALMVSAGRLPDPELVIALDNLPVSGPDAYSMTDDFMTMRRVGVMQEFPAGSKRRLRREQAQAWTGVANADITQARLDIAREVAEAWIRRATAESTLAELKSLVPALELEASSSQATVAAGRGRTTDALAAQAAVVRLAARIRELEGEARGAVLALAQWIDADANRPLAPMPAVDTLPVPPGTLLATVHQHGSLRPYEARAAAARLDIDLAKAERRPDWSAECGVVRQYQVVLQPDRLRAFGITHRDVIEAIQGANQEAGGAVLELAEAEYVVRASGYLKTLEDFRNVPLRADEGGVPVRLGDVARVQIGPELRRGITELNGEGEVVGGIIVMRSGKNALETIDAVKRKLAQLKPGLPEGVEIGETYDRSELIERAVSNLSGKLVEEFVVVALVCLAFLFHWRSGLVAIISLPLLRFA